jgi:hypothetical protein
MGIQINGQTDNISATDGSLTVSGADLGSASASSLNISGIVTASGGLLVGTGESISSPTTNVLALGTNSAERVRIDADGNFNLVNTAGIMTAFKYETPALINNHFKSNSTSSGDYVRLYAGSGTGKWDIYGNAANLRFSDNDSAGNIQMDRPLVMNSQNIVMSSGNGIDFSATSGTGTSELLDDYEEGTFTPSFTGGTSGSGYTRQVGEYTKVGRLVTFILTIDGDGLTGTATAIEIGGLPFTSRNVAELGGAQYTYPGNFDTTNDRRFWLVAQNNTTLSYRSATSANINGNLVNNVNSQFVLYGHYFTDS